MYSSEINFYSNLNISHGYGNSMAHLVNSSFIFELSKSDYVNLIKNADHYLKSQGENTFIKKINEFEKLSKNSVPSIRKKVLLKQLQGMFRSVITEDDYLWKDKVKKNKGYSQALITSALLERFSLVERKAKYDSNMEFSAEFDPNLAPAISQELDQMSICYDRLRHVKYNEKSKFISQNFESFRSVLDDEVAFVSGQISDVCSHAVPHHDSYSYAPSLFHASLITEEYENKFGLFNLLTSFDPTKVYALLTNQQVFDLNEIHLNSAKKFLDKSSFGLVYRTLSEYDKDESKKLYDELSDLGSMVNDALGL